MPEQAADTDQIRIPVLREGDELLFVEQRKPDVARQVRAVMEGKESATISAPRGKLLALKLQESTSPTIAVISVTFRREAERLMVSAAKTPDGKQLDLREAFAPKVSAPLAPTREHSTEGTTVDWKPQPVAVEKMAVKSGPEPALRAYLVELVREEKGAGLVLCQLLLQKHFGGFDDKKPLYQQTGALNAQGMAPFFSDILVRAVTAPYDGGALQRAARVFCKHVAAQGGLAGAWATELLGKGSPMQEVPAMQHQVGVESGKGPKTAMQLLAMLESAKPDEVARGLAELARTAKIATWGKMAGRSADQHHALKKIGALVKASAPKTKDKVAEPPIEVQQTIGFAVAMGQIKGDAKRQIQMGVTDALKWAGREEKT